MRKPQLIICFGVSGCGKSTVANRLAQKLNFTYIDADDFHPAENVKHMAAGNPLTDEMREPWNRSIYTYLEKQVTKEKNCVMAHSCLRKQHRQHFRTLAADIHYFHLNGDYPLIFKRMENRNNHYMKETLLASQFNDFEQYDNEADVVSIDIRFSVDQVVQHINEHLPVFLSAIEPGEYGNE